ncbi:MAG: extensin family protein [Planktotalea sp.]|uniref:extensin-like domain-containing protein n=1 Tax=Planktotalea sp. TaxID=2029877 RepID=UPI003C708C99
MRYLIAAALVASLALPVAALAPDASPRPLARGQEPVQALKRPQLRSETGAGVVAAIAGPARPKIRPLSEQERAMADSSGAQIILASAAVGLPQSLHPTTRPDGLAEKVMAKRRKAEREQARGAICGDPAIQGDVVGLVPGRINGCGVKNAVKVRSVSGIALSQSSIMDCGTAKALKQWVDKGLKPSIGKRGGGIASIKVAAHYACRTRNNQKGAKISEHGKGRAIDIAGFKLKSGEEITVLKGWRSNKNGKPLKSMHKAACGPFGTVLGPNADRFHQDHFHFDTARYRSGSYCR